MTPKEKTNRTGKVIREKKKTDADTKESPELKNVGDE